MPLSIRSLTPLLQVYDMAESVAFYRDVLGFEVVATSGQDVADAGWVMLKLNDSVLMLNTQYDPDVPRPPRDATRAKFHDDTALYFGCEDADEVYAHLQAKGWKAKPPNDAPYGMRQVYTRDPDGFNVCFQHPVKK
jgi:catechol 2,3-dioxygenase-like lactoylglutathione lyase family enzyme